MMFIIINLFLIYRKKSLLFSLLGRGLILKKFLYIGNYFFISLEEEAKRLYIEKVLCITVYFFRIFGLLEEEIKIYI